MLLKQFQTFKSSIDPLKFQPFSTNQKTKKFLFKDRIEILHFLDFFLPIYCLKSFFPARRNKF